MPVYEASYRSWEGRGGRRAGKKLAIAGTMIRRVFRIRLVKFFVLVTVIGASFMSSLILYLRHEELMQQLNRTGVLANVNFLHFVNRGFLQSGIPIAMILAALAGAPLIAEDRRARSLALYFSRPITHTDYVVGKFLAVAFFLALLLVTPPLLMYLTDASLAKAPGAFQEGFPSFLTSLVVPGAAVALFSAMSLGASAVSRRPPYAAFLVLGAVFLSSGLGHALAREVFHDGRWFLLSPTQALQRIAAEVMPVPASSGIRIPRRLAEVGVGWAWGSVGAWTALGFLLVVLKVRRAEVVS